MARTVYQFIYSLDSVPLEEMARVGGKAGSLSRLMALGKIRVPEGYVIPANGFVNGALRAETEAELRDLVAGLDSGVTYAVRSSALNEDGAEASFAGQYETLTNVPKDGVFNAVTKVVSSAESARVDVYAKNRGVGSAAGDRSTDADADGGDADGVDDGASSGNGIAVVIQRFVQPEYAGVIFTSDVISGRDDALVGNFVRGEGEKLVSGAENAEEFRIGMLKKYSYTGPDTMKPYGKVLRKYCRLIRREYGVPMDIEWAVSGGKVYILQARPITTLRRLNMDTYEVNGTKSRYKMLTRTNVGEIFQKPVTPMTFSVLEKINDWLGLPDWLDNICGQPYMNISVICSILVSFGKSEEKAYDAIKELVGNVPEGVKVPISPFEKRPFFRKLKTIFFPKQKCKLSKKEKLELVARMDEVSRELMKEIRKLSSNEVLSAYWEDVLLPKMLDILSAIMGASGTSLVPLFSTRKKIGKIAGEEMANRLCGGCVGTIECMKPVLLLEDVISGKMTREEYRNTCGQRCVGEMELMEPRPYEDPSFPDALIEQHKKSGANLHEMQKKQQDAFAVALAEFKRLYPRKKNWIDKKIKAFAEANVFREDLRSKGVWAFSLFREFLLRVGAVNALGDDVFMLTIDEAFGLLKGDRSGLSHIAARKATYETYLTYPSFPTLILGRFDEQAWMGDPKRRNDFYSDGTECGSDAGGAYAGAGSAGMAMSSDVKGFPGAAGKVTGVVRVVTDVDRIDEIQEGDILVTVATNIGWTLVFPRVSAIVTDIGAPLSHAAIVAREFGIPAVVGCGNATTVLKTGDTVVVDGAAGTVTKV